MEDSCLGLDQEAVADQVAGDQRVDWGLLLAFGAIGFQLSGFLQVPKIRLSFAYPDGASFRFLWNTVRIKDQTPCRSFSAGQAIDRVREGDCAQRRSKQVELAQSIEVARSSLLLFFKR